MSGHDGGHDDGQGTDPDGAPPWLAEVLAAPVRQGMVEVEGCPIATLAWGEPAAPLIVLVHGGAAHARWWRALAPMLAREHQVVALDLSGHGDSGWRERYDPAQWAREVLAVAAAHGDGPPVVVGHSMGGLVTVVAAANDGERIDGAIVLDAPVRRPDPESAEGARGRAFRAPKTYPDLDTALAHFHLVPAQPRTNPWLLDVLARDSLREVDDGWTWKFDPRVFTGRVGPRLHSDFAPALARASCRFAVVNGERSTVVDDGVRAAMAELLAGSPAAAAGVPFVEVPQAHHHLLLDQPVATVTAIRGVLAAWRPVGRPPARVAG